MPSGHETSPPPVGSRCIRTCHPSHPTAICMSFCPLFCKEVSRSIMHVSFLSESCTFRKVGRIRLHGDTNDWSPNLKKRRKEKVTPENQSLGFHCLLSPSSSCRFSSLFILRGSGERTTQGGVEWAGQGRGGDSLSNEGREVTRTFSLENACGQVGESNYSPFPLRSFDEERWVHFRIYDRVF